MELKTYITLFILGNIINLLCKQKGILACGLWGFCGASAPDPLKLAVLALINLKRGEHATGFYADGVITKATENAPIFLSKHYQDFMALGDIKNFVVIGHDRQTSVGYRENLEQAHPHGVKKGEKYEFVLAHNGTIQNTTMMSEHYKIPHQHGTHSDSQLLTKIMASLDKSTMLEPLKRYTGTATVTFTMPRFKHTVFIHRDKERELYCFQETADRLYWSSIKESLFAIGGTEENVAEFKPFEACQITKGAIKERWSTADRDPLEYKAPIITRNTKNGVGFNNWAQNDDLKKSSGVSGIGLVFTNHRYFLNGHLYTGPLHLNGISNLYSKIPQEGFEKVFFAAGLMAKDEKSYDKLYQMGLTNGAFDVKKFNNIASVITCEYTKYPVLAGIQVTKGTLFFVGEYHRTNFKLDKNAMTYCPLFSPYTVTINNNGVMMEQKDIKDFKACKEVLGEVENARGSFDNTTDAIVECLKTEHQDFSTLYDAVRYAMGQGDTSKLYDEVVTTFLDVAVQSQAVEEEYVDNLKSETHFDQTNSENLNILLQLYYSSSNREDGEYDLEQQMKDIQKENNWSSHNGFCEDISNLRYNSLDDLLIAYCDTDEDEVTKPFLMGVALELMRLGAMTSAQVISMQYYKPIQFQQSLKRYYEIYATASTPSSQNCCVVDPTRTVADLYMKAADLKCIPGDKITDAEKNELRFIMSNIKNLVDKHEKCASIDEDRLRKTHALELNIIKSIYE